MLNGDVIDGIMPRRKEEVDKVIISGMELEKYFGKEKTSQEMKDQIIKLLDDWKGKQKEQAKPEKKAAPRSRTRGSGSSWPEVSFKSGALPAPRSSKDIYRFPVAVVCIAHLGKAVRGWRLRHRLRRRSP
ncbi:MAG: hypothetical protein ACLR0U_10890 [Enterocloster clostridioformis]